jgi:hypothetical protein
MIRNMTGANPPELVSEGGFTTLDDMVRYLKAPTASAG